LIIAGAGGGPPKSAGDGGRPLTPLPVIWGCRCHRGPRPPRGFSTSPAFFRCRQMPRPWHFPVHRGDPAKRAPKQTPGLFAPQILGKRGGNPVLGEQADGPTRAELHDQVRGGKNSSRLKRSENGGLLRADAKAPRSNDQACDRERVRSFPGPGLACRLLAAQCVSCCARLPAAAGRRSRPDPSRPPLIALPLPRQSPKAAGSRVSGCPSLLALCPTGARLGAGLAGAGVRWVLVPRPGRPAGRSAQRLAPLGLVQG